MAPLNAIELLICNEPNMATEINDAMRPNGCDPPTTAKLERRRLSRPPR